MSQKLSEKIAQAILSEEARRFLTQKKRQYRIQRTRVGNFDFGDFHQTRPVSSIFGIDRGKPIDRYYIEEFLNHNRKDIVGRCLEMGDSSYITQFGTAVTRIDVLHYVEGNPKATIVGDLTDAPQIASDTFDCIIFTQTLQMIYDLKAAMRTLHRILAPGGVLLLTSAGIGKIARHLDKDDWGEYWHLTTQSMNKIFEETFPDAVVRIDSYGNVLSTTCFLQGLATEELPKSKLDVKDKSYELLVVARAQKKQSNTN